MNIDEQLSIKLISDVPGVGEVWEDIDSFPELGGGQEIAVFDSLIGQYERFKDASAAEERYQTHVQRLTPLTKGSKVGPKISKLEKKLNKKIFSSPIIIREGIVPWLK